MRLLVGRRFDFILAIGHVGVAWYRQCGYPSRKIFPYGYVTEAPTLCEPHPAPGDHVRLAYVGRTATGKGLDLLIRSLCNLEGRPWSLTVIGDGPDRGGLERLADGCGLAKQITWRGMLPNDAAMRELCDHDLLILPSTRKDGWGAVVNEALLRGVPVVCSDRCGAADLLGEPWRGGVFRSGDADDLTRLLAEWIRRGRRSEALTNRIRQWSQAIEGRAVAQYLLDILDHVYQGKPRPLPPWNRRRAA